MCWFRLGVSGASSTAAFVRFVCWALIPVKMPVYSRKDWRQSAEAVDWVGILAAYGLLDRVLYKFAGKPRPPPTTQHEFAFSAVQDDVNKNQMPVGNAAEEEQDEEMHEEKDDNKDGGTAEPRAAEDAFQERKRRNRVSMLTWCISDPYPRLVFLREVLSFSEFGQRTLFV